MKILSVYIVLLFVFEILFPTHGLPQNCLWSEQAGGTGNDLGQRIIFDKDGNNYISGWSESSPCYFNGDSINSGITSSSFIVKYNNSGQEIWVLDLVKGAGPKVGEWGNIAMVMDTLTNQLLLTGYFYDYLSLKDTVVAGLNNTIFLIRMDTDGNIIWCKTAGGVGDDQAFDITYDPEGNIYISGSNESDATFGQFTIPRGGFLAKYDASGNVIWVKNKFRFFNKWELDSGYPFTEAQPTSIHFANNSLLINGEAQNDTVVFDSVTFINSYGFESSYLASYSIDGNLNWVKLAGGPGGGSGSSFSTDKSNNIYITGVYSSVGVFGNDTLKQPGGKGDCFLAKYDFNGNFKWVNNTNSSALGIAITTSMDSSIYLGGWFSGKAYFGNIILTSSSVMDMFLAKYASDGSNIGVRQYHSGTICGVAMDGSNNICFTGDFDDKLNIGSNTFISKGQNDFFVAQRSPILGGIQSTQSNQLLIYANPNSGICNIVIPDDFKHEKTLSLTIFNMQGKVIEKVPIEK